MMRVIPISKAIVDEFVTKKHYSHRPSIFWKGFGLEENGLIEGIACFGQPSPPIQKHAFKNRDFRLYELGRVVVQTSSKNAASFLLSHALRQLEPKPCAIVTYSDMEFGHSGIIYQASNWIYTGFTKSHDVSYLVNGERLHPITIRDRYKVTSPIKWAKENSIQIIKPANKHRYFFFVGDKKQVKDMKGRLNYPIVTPYPKSDKVMYDSGERILINAY